MKNEAGTSETLKLTDNLLRSGGNRFPWGYVAGTRLVVGV
jgi:hypothetical protein